MAQTPVPPTNDPVVNPETGKTSPVWEKHWQILYKQLGGLSGLDIFPTFWVEATIPATSLNSSGTKTIVSVTGNSQYKVREIFLSGDGTNYGAGGDRDIAIQDSSGTRVYSIIPNATVESLAAGRWGDTAVPYPTTAEDFFSATTVGEDIVAKYSGGSTDPGIVGSLTIALLVEKVA